MSELWAALGGALLGGLLTLVAAEWSYRRARAAAEIEANRQDAAVLDGLIAEIEASERVAREVSATHLPVDYLGRAMPLRRYMDPEEEAAFAAYAQAVLRYNGRVERIIAYGTGKRAAGLSPGAEKPKQHAPEVVRTAPEARKRLSALVARRQQLGGR
jgi:hypothetical protein